MALSREDIQLVKDSDIQAQHVSRWGGELFVRSMASGHWDEIQELIGILPEKGTIEYTRALLEFKRKLVSFSLCDEKGELLFDDEEGRAILASKSYEPINEVATVAMSINNLSEEEDDNEKKSYELTSTTALSSSCG